MAHAVAPSRVPVAVAIPARDEEDHIGACLDAIGCQTIRPDMVTVLLNNCTDSTGQRIRGMKLDIPCNVVDVELSAESGGAGVARRLAMERAARCIGCSGVLMTTDADAIVPPDWIERNIMAINAGADAVCGRAVLSDSDAAAIPKTLRVDDELEQRLLALADQMAWLIDPDPIDPLPRHTEASGASIAVSVAAWRRAGGIPSIRTGEDRAFIAALRRIDAAIRHDPSIEVVVSGRTFGRADGGMADTIRRRMIVQDEFADDCVEPPDDSLRRLLLRARFRAAWQIGQVDPFLVKELDITPNLLQGCLRRRYFGAAWEAVSSRGRLAERRRVRFAELPTAITRAEHLVAELMPPEILAAD